MSTTITGRVDADILARSIRHASGPAGALRARPWRSAALDGWLASLYGTKDSRCTFRKLGGRLALKAIIDLLAACLERRQMHLRVLTLNVWNDEGKPQRIDAINNELRRLAPDLVAFQEVVHAPGREQLERLLRGTDLHGTHQAHVMAVAPPGADRYGGSAVATRWPHRIVEVLDLRLWDAADHPWCTLAAVVSLPGEGELLFIAATAAWRLDAESARERQVTAIADLDGRHRRALPTIIAGDFNSPPDSASIRFLTGLQSLSGRSVHYHDTWAVAGTGPGHTWNADNPNTAAVSDQIVRQPNHRRRIDYVFVGSWHAHPRAHCRIRAATLAFDRPIDEIWTSDHFGVVADLDIGQDN